jgi:hypothetical protein
MENSQGGTAEFMTGVQIAAGKFNSSAVYSLHLVPQ